MAATLLFENVAGQVLLDPAGYLRLVWNAQPRQLPDTQALLLALSTGLRQHRLGRVFTNQTQMAPLSPDEQRWISQHWLPTEGRAAGYRAGAILVAGNVLTRLATATVTTSQEGTRYRSFDDEKAALEWLLRQPA